eukprot:8404954-Alexandrium_andersonii.AAC.1
MSSTRASPCARRSCSSRRPNDPGSSAYTSSVGPTPGASSTTLAPSASRSMRSPSRPWAPTRRSSATPILRTPRRA